MHHCVIKLSSMEADTENSNMKQACLRPSGQKWNHHLYVSPQRRIKTFQTELSAQTHRHSSSLREEVQAAVDREVSRLCSSSPWYEASAPRRSRSRWINSACSFVRRITQPAERSITTPSLLEIKHVNGRLVMAAAIEERQRAAERPHRQHITESVNC